MPLEIRRAGVDDASTLSTLAARTFTETFGHLYPPEDLDAFLRESYAVGPAGLRHPEAAPGDGGIRRRYVLRDYQSGGLGGKLMDAAMDWLLRDGPRTLWVGVWSENAGAQRFYQRRGFARVGEYLFPV